jgi:hypothetical protein
MNIGWVKLWVHAPFLVNKMKNKKYQTVVIIPKSNTKVPEEAKSILLTHSGLMQALQ